MTWFVNLPTRTKLFLSFGLLVVFLAVIIVAAYYGLTSLQKAQETLYKEHFVTALDLAQIRSDMNRERVEVLEVILTTDKAAWAASEREIRDRDKDIDVRMQRATDLLHDEPNLLDKLKEMRTTLDVFRQTRATQLDLVQKGKTEEARQLSLNVQKERFDKLREQARTLGTEVEHRAEAAVKHSVETANQLILTFVVIGLATLLLAAAMAALLNRLIANPLATFTQFVDRVGRGDLTQQAAVAEASANSSRDEVNKLGHTLNGMVRGLKEMAGQIRGVTQNLNSASVEIMSSIQEQASSTKEQAATVQEITTTMNEVSQSGAQISAKAKQVAAAAEATSAASSSGMQAVQDTSKTMGAIREQVEEVAENIVALSEKTQAVGEIIATVNDIAERSNLLALNAAIEAAAAGEQGNRFSVVANEMKNLADQAKESTVQVRTILGDIQKGINSSVMLTEEAVKRVETGKQQADVTEQTIRQMATTTLESVQAFEQIVGAGNQQQIGFEQVAQGMKDIQQAAGQTATATVQLEKAVANLNALGQELKEAVGRYQL